MKSYIEKYGLEQVKKNLKYKKRYFEIVGGYANEGIELFDSYLFKRDIGMADFPIAKREYLGATYDKAPTLEEFEVIYKAQIEKVKD